MDNVYNETPIHNANDNGISINDNGISDDPERDT